MTRGMIDKDGYRPNVGILIANGHNKLLWAKRKGRSSWQFPQGGIAEGESAEEAMYRELYEETGLCGHDVDILGTTQRWLRYVVPKKFRRKVCDGHPVCIGQKQKWFILRLVSSEDNVRLDAHHTPEFDRWRWIDYWDCLDEVIYFKRSVYRSALKELRPVLTKPKGSACD
jgi:putative (di)nucleoside polyphosphate hydrolase